MGLNTASYDVTELPPFSGMEFIRNFGPAGGPIRGEPMWDGLPDVFNLEPRPFGMLDDTQDNQMN